MASCQNYTEKQADVITIKYCVVSKPAEKQFDDILFN